MKLKIRWFAVLLALVLAVGMLHVAALAGEDASTGGETAQESAEQASADVPGAVAPDKADPEERSGKGANDASKPGDDPAPGDNPGAGGDGQGDDTPGGDTPGGDTPDDGQTGDTPGGGQTGDTPGDGQPGDTPGDGQTGDTLGDTPGGDTPGDGQGGDGGAEEPAPEAVLPMDGEPVPEEPDVNRNRVLHITFEWNLADDLEYDFEIPESAEANDDVTGKLMGYLNNYEFVSVTAQGEDGTPVDVVILSDREFSFKMPAQSVHLTIVVQKARCRLTRLTVTGGDLVPNFDPKVTEYKVNVDYEVEAIGLALESNSGIRINPDQWSDPSYEYHTSYPNTPKKVTGSVPLAVGDNVVNIRVNTINGMAESTDYQITIHRDAPWYTVTVGVANYSEGSGTVSGGGRFRYGEKTTFTATPDPGSVFSGWVNENADSWPFAGGTCEITVGGNMEIYAVFDRMRGLWADPEAFDFGTEEEGYAPITVKPCTLRNSWSYQEAVVTGLTGAPHFEAALPPGEGTLPKTIAEDNGFANLAIKPKDGLPPDTYEETLTVAYTGAGVGSDGGQLRIPLKFIVTPRPEYHWLDASGTRVTTLSWRKGSGEALNCALKRTMDDGVTFDSFDALYMDGEPVSETHYTKAPGSVKLSIKPEYLETLSEGSHDLLAVMRDGEPMVRLNVLAPEPTPTPKPASGGKKSGGAPETGDPGQAALWAGATLAALAAALLLMRGRRTAK